MLKKLLTTIIVLAATATAWADGYSYTLDKDNTRATISADADSENTIDDVITAIKGLSPKVQYVILPDGMTKEQVNAIGASFDATVSKNEATQTETKWVYTWNEKEVVFEGTPTTIDGKPTATVKVLVPLKEKNSSYQLYGSPYEGTVFFDAEGKCYGVSNETSDTFSLTSYKGYTYNSGTTEYTGKVAESEDMYYGVINPTSEVALRLNQPVSWTYNLNYDNSITYAHFGEVYNNGTYIFYQGGTEYPLTTETRYTYDDNGSKKLYPEDGLTRTADNKTFGWVGGTQVNLTQKDAWFNGTTLYTGAIRKEGETTAYGNTGNPYNLSQESVYTYTDNGTKKWYKGAIRDVEENGETTYYGNSSYGGNIEEYPLTEKEGNTYTLNNVTEEYSGLVRTDSEGKSWGNTGEQFPITKQEGKYTYDNYGKKAIYEGTVYKKVADNTYWGIWSGTEIELEEKKNAYTYKLNSWPNDKAVYTGGATRTDANGIIYGNTGEMFPLTTTTAPWTYDNGKYIYEGEYFSGTNGNVGGTFYELQTITATAEKPVYTYYSSGIQYYYDGEVTYDSNTWPNYFGTVNGVKVGLTQNSSGVYKYYTKDGKNIIYTGTVYTKFDGTVEYEYACEGAVAITKAEGDVKYYTDTDYKKVVYTGNVYTDNDKEYGVKDAGKDVVLTKEDVIVRSDNNSIYTAEKYYNVGTESLVGIEYPSLFALEYGTIYIKADNSIYTGEYYCDDKGNYYGYDGTEVLLTNGIYYLKDNGDVYSDKVFYYLKEDKSKSFVGYSYISDVVITEGEEYLYTKEEQQLLYTGKVYHQQGDENKYIGFENYQYTEIPLTPGKAWFYTSDGEETQYTAGIYNDGENTVGFIGGTEYTLTQGDVKYYTKDEQTVIATENSRISLDGDTYCEGGTNIVLTNKEEGYTANLYTDGEGRSVIYTGKVYGDATGYIGGTETVLDHGDIYKKEDGTIYTGYRNADNTMGCNDAILLTTSFTYEYVNPNTGETATLESVNHLTTYKVDYTVTVEQKEIEVPTGKIHLIAYVSIPGSLYYAIGDKRFGGADLTALTLSGSLNAADIASHDGMKLTGNGHAKYKTYPSAGQETDNDPIVPADDNAMPGTYPAFANITLLTYIDFSDAVFNVQTDMQINNMAHSVNGLKTVFLPTNEKMTEIPAHCLWGANGIEEICIPYNYEKIGAEAFYNTSISHFYTTDAAGNIITNGPNTMTFSENLRIIETSDSHEPTFSGAGANKITDVYVMRYNPEDTEYPTTHCQTKAFQASMLYGNNGNLGDMAHPIQRSNYINQGMWFAVLHYPQDIEEEYEKMYTDITRVYTLKDETGLVDGKGKAYVWPTHGQLGKAYTTIVQNKTNFEGKAYAQEFLAKHSGWLEFVLTGKSNTRDYDPQSENTQFVYRDWLTICVPYDLKRSQLLSILGVNPDGEDQIVDPTPTGTDAEGNPVFGNIISTTTTPLYPDVRALTHVSRSVNNGKMILHFAKLVEQEGENVKCYDVEISKMNGEENEHGQGFTKTERTEDDPVVMKGGHPYLIRAYVPAAWNEKIKNLGMYIMSAASSANHAAMVAGEEEPYKYGDCTVTAAGGDMYLPCLKHKVHAFDADAGHGTDVTQATVGEGSSDFVYNTGNDDPALYHFVGTYYDTKIPQYAYYIGKAKDGSHKFTRTTRPLDSAYTWAPYTAVIVGLSNPEYKDLDDHAANEKDELQNIVPEVNNGNDLVILAHEARKHNKQAGARLSLGGFDDSTATGIVDVNVSENVNVSNNKVYSINGQYMGTSLNKLPKGIYIINGQKKVVK